jgi:hypothetical protein
MSIHKMISLHPDVGGDLNEPLATAARHAMFLCNHVHIMRRCLRRREDGHAPMHPLVPRLCDVSGATSRLAVRRTGQNVEALRAMLDVCARFCALCAEECSRHDHEHCKLCASMRGECERDCRAAIATL